MIGRNESLLVRQILVLSRENNACLVSLETLKTLINKKNLTEQKIKTLLINLQLEDYIDLISCERQGEQIYCITPKQKSKALSLEKKQIRKSVVFKILLALLGSVVAFIVTAILKRFFNG